MTKFIALGVSAFLLVQYTYPLDDWSMSPQQRQQQQMKRQLDDIQEQQRRMRSDMQSQQLMNQSNCIMRGNYNCP
jgi:hypothetical protein